MEEKRDLFLPQPFLRAFPSADAVFAAPVARYERHLHPLVSIELSAVYPGLSGWIHLVSPIEPCDGYLGDNGKAAWGPYLQRNWIAFRLTDQHRYELLGDFRFFGIENAECEEGAREELEEFYGEQSKSFVEEQDGVGAKVAVAPPRNSGDELEQSAIARSGSSILIRVCEGTTRHLHPGHVADRCPPTELRQCSRRSELP